MEFEKTSPRSETIVDLTFPQHSNLTDFESKIQQLGLEEIKEDYSEEHEITVDEPWCAYVNIVGTDKMPTKKGQPQNVWMQVYMADGTYFCKRAIIDAQGNSSLNKEKKNFKAEFCDDEWMGDSTVDITIGDWVKQDEFHFKAYYIDWLRGIGVVGYRLYDQIALDAGRPWTRSSGHVKKPDAHALCHPDGFPCVVYLDGSFYGVFAWQLKKHRRNMNMQKSNPEHVHLDGYMIRETLWHTDSIQWGQFEVRNPRGLYDMFGKPYDGDHPTELIDETSAYYDMADDDEDVRAAKANTARVKQYVVELAGTYAQMMQMFEEGAGEDALRAWFELHFDRQSLIDYVCLYNIIDNFDGFAKNWQWYTYDGVKWFVAPYDLDCIMGNHHSGVCSIPATQNSVGESYSRPRPVGPFNWVYQLYADDIRERYCYLRDSGICTADGIKSLVHDWYRRVGSDNYVQEWERWPNSQCISEVIAADGWRLADVFPWGYATWDKSITYQSGQRCYMDYYIWEATESTTGVKPYIQLGYQDSLERYESWIDQRLQLFDDYYGYVSQGVSHVVEDADSRRCAIYDAAGHLIRQPQSGLNIYRYADGRSVKVLLP